MLTESLQTTAWHQDTAIPHRYCDHFYMITILKSIIKATNQTHFSISGFKSLQIGNISHWISVWLPVNEHQSYYIMCYFHESKIFETLQQFYMKNILPFYFTNKLNGF